MASQAPTDEDEQDLSSANNVFSQTNVNNAMSYLSSSASSDHSMDRNPKAAKLNTPNNHNPKEVLPQPLPLEKSTIDFRKLTGDSEMINILPEHQFLQPQHSMEDASDASTGSVIFAGPPRPSGEAQTPSSFQAHDRFPSFDSVASNGSFLLTGGSKASPSMGKPAATPGPPAAGMSSNSALNTNATPVQFLPYDQRRKLLQKRNEEQQPPPSSSPPKIPQPPPPQMRPPMGHDPSLTQQHPHAQMPLPPHFPRYPPPPMHYMGEVHPPHPGMPYPSQPPPNMPVPYVEIGGPPMNMMGPNPPLPHPPQQPSQHTTNKPRKATLSSKARGGEGDAIDMPRKPPLHLRTISGGGAAAPPPRGRTSSTDSESKGLPPPPPSHPPPPQYHIRTESTGSVSSIGSGEAGREGGLIMGPDGRPVEGNLEQPPQQYLMAQQQPPPPQGMQGPPQGGFFGFFHGHPPPQGHSQSPGNMSVEEYHMRNQEFLRAQQHLRDASPSRRPPSSPRLPRHAPNLAPINDEPFDEPPRREAPRRERGSSDGRRKQEDRRRRGEGGGDRRPVEVYYQQQQQQRYPEYPEYLPQQHYPDPYYHPADAYGYPLYHHQQHVAYAPPPHQVRQGPGYAGGHSGNLSSNSEVSSGDGYSDDDVSAEAGRREDFVLDEADERTSLLPPPGISTHEQRDRNTSYTESSRDRKRSGRSSRPSRSRSAQSESDRASRQVWRGDVPDPSMETTQRFDNRAVSRMMAQGEEYRQGWDSRTGTYMSIDDRRKQKSRKKKGRKKRSRRKQYEDSDPGLSSSSSSYPGEREKERFMKKEKKKIIAEWKAQAAAEAEEARRIAEENRWYRRICRCIKGETTPIIRGFASLLGLLETFFSNLPLTVGAVALAIATLGVVWFKFAEENLDSCAPVHFHSSQCTFPEFPGCFYCDTTSTLYKVALNFHFTCSAVAGLLAMSFILKVLLATRLVLDEMSSPTTASPAGLICMTTVVVFAGRGVIGQYLVSAAAALHLCLAIWFIYMALAYHIMPEPSWYPNTVGIGLTAVKIWLYFPLLGHLLMAVSLSLNCFFFPISLIRVTLNKKMSATVCWIQMSAPAISLYALTIMAQPSFVEEHPDVTNFQRVHRMVYMPCMHVLFALACVGVISSVQSLWVRWDDFKTRPFSPAHAAFCFPTLAHTNAIQAYRASLNSFADLSPKSPFRMAVYTYWVTFLVLGTIATLYITAKFFYHLPAWTIFDIEDEEEPPAPYETQLTLKDVITTGETISQPFVSPAVLQANETGALVMLPHAFRDGRRRYRRTRQLTALGFEPIMEVLELDREREVLLDYVAKHPPRRRTQTLSVPGIDFNYGFGEGIGVGHSGVYDAQDPRHTRAATIAHGFPVNRPPTQEPWRYRSR